MHTNSPSRSDHVSFVDALVISAACRRPIRFIMDNAIFQAPVIRTLAKDDAAVYEQAFEAAGAAW
jgi:1-acyl-sn-glycerol-3-phosphate acyltransferase